MDEKRCIDDSDSQWSRIRGLRKAVFDVQKGMEDEYQMNLRNSSHPQGPNYSSDQPPVKPRIFT